MSENKLSGFAAQKYLNLETYRKNGAAIRTPMWFAESGGAIYLYTLANAMKVKRIRNNPRVRIAPSDMRGNPKGEWVEARARIVDAAEAERGHRLLRQKYGWMKRLGDFFSKIRRRERVVIAIEFN
ncbi:MAG TPA: PPOX class F420-dependent oxidoreductase [Blastocatellia bacterium]|nr:PPOX class F420-dependent oxidoreductase [Blastocatellia bacterium]